jgi:hypothetical protein
MIERTAFIISAALASATFLHAQPAALQPTAESQKTLTPDSALSELATGNEAYIAGKTTDLLVQIEPAIDKVKGQETDRSSKNEEFVGGVYLLHTGKVRMLP